MDIEQKILDYANDKTHEHFYAINWDVLFALIALILSISGYILGILFYANQK